VRGVSIQVYFIHDESGLKWYSDETGNGGRLDTSTAAQDGPSYTDLQPTGTNILTV
jgi:hypothetical protein